MPVENSDISPRCSMVIGGFVSKDIVCELRVVIKNSAMIYHERVELEGGLDAALISGEAIVLKSDRDEVFTSLSEFCERHKLPYRLTVRHDVEFESVTVFDGSSEFDYLVSPTGPLLHMDELLDAKRRGELSHHVDQLCMAAEYTIQIDFETGLLKSDIPF